MSNAGKAFAVALLVALAWAVAPVAEAQPGTLTVEHHVDTFHI